MTELVAKRRLTDIKFEHDGAHVALVGKHQGGPANGVTTLVYKAVDVSDELVQKASEVVVTLSFTEFLRKFFNMYWDDAEVLAKVLGYGEEEEEEDDEEEDDGPKSYIDSRVAAISLMKSVYAASDMQAALAALTPEESLSLLQAQEVLEKAMSSAVPEGDETLTSTTTEENVSMDTIEKALHEELVAKAVGEAQEVLKAELSAQAEVLKAVESELAVFKAAAEAQRIEVRKSALKGAGIADEEVEELFKAVGALEDEAFQAIVKQFAAKAALADQSDLFKETGVAGVGEQDPAEVDGTAAILKAKYHK